MASLLVKLESIKDLAPGKSVTRHWNNASPADAVWYIQAVPLESSFTSFEPIEQSVAAEVTRVWRRLNRKANPKEFPEGPIYEHEIWYVVKNVGGREVDVDVYASITEVGKPSHVLVKQYGGDIHATSDETATKTATWKPPDGKPRDVLAEIALNHVHDYAEAAITKMVSTEAGVETSKAGIRYRTGVTEVQFTLTVSESGASARWIIHEFS